MLLVLLAAGAAQTIDPGMVRAPGEATRCNPELARTVAITPAEARKLGELPPGLVQLAVNKRVAGCSVTVLPQRDENGQHLMMRGEPGGLTPTHDARSRGQGRPQRKR